MRLLEGQAARKSVTLPLYFAPLLAWLARAVSRHQILAIPLIQQTI